MKLKILLPVLLTLTLTNSVPVNAADIVWTNMAGGNWNVAANWEPNTVPGTADNVHLTNARSFGRACWPIVLSFGINQHQP